MSLTIFVMVTYETLPVGLLSSIAADLGSGEQGAGLLVSSYAVVVVLAAIPLSAVVVRFEPRWVLVVVLGAFVLSAVVMATSDVLVTALAARVLGGLAHSVLLTTVFRIGLAALPAAREGLAASVLNLGNSIALFFGIPVTSALGVAMSWQVPFYAVAAAFVVLAVATVVVVLAGRGQAGAGVTAATTLRAARQPALLRVGLTVTLLITAQFISYTYLEPVLRAAGVPQGRVSWVLFAFGVASVVMVLAATPLADRRPAATLRVASAAVAVVMVGLWLAHTSAVGTAVTVVAWGLAFGAVPVLLQVLCLRAAGPAKEVAPAVLNATYNVGIAAGSLIGGQVLVLAAGAGGGPVVIPLVSAALLGVVVTLMLRRGWLPPDTRPQSQAAPDQPDQSDRPDQLRHRPHEGAAR